MQASGRASILTLAWLQIPFLIYATVGDSLRNSFPCFVAIEFGGDERD